MNKIIEVFKFYLTTFEIVLIEIIFFFFFEDSPDIFLPMIECHSHKYRLDELMLISVLSQTYIYNCFD